MVVLSAKTRIPHIRLGGLSSISPELVLVPESPDEGNAGSPKPTLGIGEMRHFTQPFQGRKSRFSLPSVGRGDGFFVPRIDISRHDQHWAMTG